MLRINNIVLRNFLSIGNVEQSIDLSIDGLTLVLGENADVGGENSRNGVGKTAILQAICYGLFGKPLARIRLDNLVNAVNGKGMLVTLDFEANGKKYRIERGRKPNVLHFYRDGVALKQNDEAQGESKHTQAEIERVLGMTSVMFKHIVALNTNTPAFLSEEAAVQRDVIEELLGITLLSQRAETLKKLIDVTKEQLRNAEAHVKANGDANVRIEQQIGRAMSEAEGWRTTQDKRVAELASKVKNLHAIDIEHEISLFDAIEQWQDNKREADGRRRTTEEKIASLSEEIDRINKDVTRYQTEARSADRGEIGRLERQAQLYLSEAGEDIHPQIERLRSEVVRRQQEGASKFAEANQLAVELAEISEQLVNPDSHHCQTCGQGLAGTAHLEKVRANLAKQESALTEKIARLLAEHDNAKQDAQAVEAEIAHVKEAHHQQQIDLQAKAAALRKEIEQATVDLAERQQSALEAVDGALRSVAEKITERQALLAERETQFAEPIPFSTYKSRDAVWQLRQQRDVLLNQLETEIERANPHDAKVEALRATLVPVDYTEVNELTSRHKHETFLHKLLTAKDSFVRKKMIDRGLKYLNKRLDHYLQGLGLPHEVVFQADLSVEISLLGASYDFEQLSRGEKNRVVMATSWAFRDVWETLNTKLHLLMVDEMLDQGTDGAGVEAALDILSAMAAERSVYLISHRDELRQRIDNVLIVRKENQFTSFV